MIETIKMSITTANIRVKMITLILDRRTGGCLQMYARKAVSCLAAIVDFLSLFLAKKPVLKFETTATKIAKLGRMIYPPPHSHHDVENPRVIPVIKTVKCFLGSVHFDIPAK